VVEQLSVEVVCLYYCLHDILVGRLVGRPVCLRHQPMVRVAVKKGIGVVSYQLRKEKKATTSHD
jgi:hypothetical protein